MDKRWICHFDEDVRSLLCAVLGDAVVSLEEAADDCWVTSPFGVIERVVSRAVWLNGSRRAARFIVRDASFSLFAPAAGGPRGKRLSIHGPLKSASVSISSAERVGQAMRDWLQALSVPACHMHREEASEFRRRVAVLLLGVVDRLDIDWIWAEANLSSDGNHTISVQPSGCLRGELPMWFRMPSVADGGRSASPELAIELSRLVGDRIHVSAGHVRRPSDMPSVFVDSPPRVRIAREDDPMARLRAAARLPAAARLMT